MRSVPPGANLLCGRENPQGGHAHALPQDHHRRRRGAGPHPERGARGDDQRRPQGEHLRGTNDADTINGNGGNDRIFGREGDDVLNGGQGNDRIFGASGNDTISGVQGNDWLNGGAGDDTISGDANGTGDLTSFDRIFGGSGNDTLHGGDSRDRIYGGSGQRHVLGRERQRPDGRRHRATTSSTAAPATTRSSPTSGQDTTYGGDGNDDLWALARGDVAPGPGVDQVGDTLDGGPGNDTFRTRDGEVDRITCGDGNDTALLDNVDVITDATAENPNGSCETVVRRAPKAKDTASEDAQQSPKDAQKTS